MSNVKTDFVRSKLTKSFLETEYVKKQRSFNDIATELNSNANRIRRAAIKLGIPIRNHSEAQKVAIDSGKVQHPTKGKVLSSETREKISDRVSSAWKDISEEERKRRADAQREKFVNQPANVIREMRTKAARAIREAASTGSKLEQAIMIALRDKGLTVEFHRKNLVANEKLEADIYLPEFKVVIEIDGITHRENVYGTKRLSKTRFADSTKNGLLLGHDFIVIRVADTAKTNSKAYNKRLWKKIEAILDDLQNVERPSVINVEDD